MTHSQNTQSSLSFQTLGNDDTQTIGIIMHGFGATGDDLYSVAEYFLDKIPFWIIPQAPVSMFHVLAYSGYAWFPQENHALQQALMGEYWDNIQALDLPEVHKLSNKLIDELIQPYYERHKTTRLVIAGFSQGGIMCTELCLACLERGIEVHKLLLFSSCAMALTRWNHSAENIRTTGKTFPKIWQSHGTMDSVILPQHARELQQFWESYADVEFLSFEGGHEIPLVTLQSAKNFLATP